jgi:hypothetical protein
LIKVALCHRVRPTAHAVQWVALAPDRSNTAPVVNEFSSDTSQAIIATASVGRRQ